MVQKIELGDVVIDVVLKDIKNVHLSVYPPNGRVRISAPSRMSLDTIRVFAISKLAWIRQQQKKIRDQERDTPREFIEKESHYVWGKRLLLAVIERNQPSTIEIKHNRMLMVIRPGASREERNALIEAWYREEIRNIAPRLIKEWEERIGVKHEQIFVQRMKTRWGSCNPRTRSIRLNTELARKPVDCLEYILVHELCHLIEPTHNDRFKELMNHYLPNWKHHRKVLNSLPLRHEDWGY